MQLWTEKIARLVELPLYGRTGLILLVESLGRVILFITTFFAASVLSSGEFAVFGVLLAVQQFVSIVAQGGLVEAVLGEVAKVSDPRERNEIYGTARRGFMILSILALVVVAFWTFFLSPLTGAQSWATSLVLLASGVISSAVIVRAGFLVMEGETTRSCLNRALLYISSSLGGLLVLIMYRSAGSYFWGSLIMTIPCGYFSLQSGSNGVGKTAAVLGKGTIKQILLQSLPFALTSLLGWASWSGAIIVIYHFFDSRITACYTLMTAVCGILIFITSAVNQAWQPDMVRSMRDGTEQLVESRRHFTNLMEFGLLGTALGLLVAIAAAKDWAVWFPAKYPELEYILPLAFASMLGSLNYFLVVNYFAFFKAGRLLLRISVFSYLSAGVLWLALGYWLGETGVYLGWGLIYMIRSIAISRAASRHWMIHTSVLRTFRILAVFGLFFYFLSMNTWIQGIRHSLLR